MKETYAKKDSERAQDGDGRRTVCNGRGVGWSWSQKNKPLPKTYYLEVWGHICNAKYMKVPHIFPNFLLKIFSNIHVCCG